MNYSGVMSFIWAPFPGEHRTQQREGRKETLLQDETLFRELRLIK